VALLVLAAVVSMVYRFVPDTDRSFWSATPGALFAVIAWAIASLGISSYLANFADRGLTYGSLGTAIGLLVYLYLSASVMLLGAEINAAIWQSVADVAEKTGKPASEDEATETHRTGMNLQGGEDGR
jgi:membrane protein